MKNLIKIIFLLSFFYTNAHAQTVTWQKTYGEPQFIEWGWAIVQLPDEGYIAVCEQRQTFNEMLILRLDRYGIVLWEKLYPLGRATEIAKMNDGNYLITGSFLVKINIDGDTLWTRPGVMGSHLMLSNNGGFYLCGAKFISSSITNPYLGKYDSLGYPEWEILYSQNIFDGGFSDMLLDNGSDLVLIGVYSESNVITSNPFIMKTDSNGNIIWFHGYNSDSLNYYYIDQIQKKTNNEFIVGGSNNLNCYFMHFDSNGYLERINYIDSNVNAVQLNSLVKTTDNEFVFTGFYRRDPNIYVRLVKTDSAGNELWRMLYGNGFSNVGYSLIQTVDSGFIIIGKSEFNFQHDIYIIKTDKTGFTSPSVNINTSSVLIPRDIILYQNFPNPFNSSTEIQFSIYESNVYKLEIYNHLGQIVNRVFDKYITFGTYAINVELENLNSGAYFYILTSNNESSIKKLVLIK